jgi:hypothetical protein
VELAQIFLVLSGIAYLQARHAVTHPWGLSSDVLSLMVSPEGTRYHLQAFRRDFGSLKAEFFETLNKIQ